MAKKNTAIAPQSAPGENKARFVAWTVTGQRHKNDKGFWTRIGAMFPHEDGEGFTVVLDALPLDGRIVLRAPKAEEDSSENQGEGA